MGLFDWLLRRRRMRTVCWFDEARAMNGIVDAVGADVAAGRHVIVVAHFEDMLIDVGRRLADGGIVFETLARWQPNDSARLRGGPPRVVVLLANALPGDDGAHAARTSGGVAASLRLCELHVRAQANRRVAEFCERLPVRADAVAYAWLDAPHLGRMIGKQMRAMMAHLGMAASAPIDSTFVTSAVTRALAKLERKVTGDRPARSLAEWLRLNLPE